MKHLTATGQAVAVAAVLLLVAGWALGYDELVVWGVACGLALGVALVVLVRSVPLEVRREVEPGRVHRGDVALGQLRITNRGRRATGALAAAEPVGGESVTVQLPRLRAGATATATYRLPTGRRAVLTVGPLTVGREDTLGLLRTTSTAGTAETLVVHPKVYRLSAGPIGRFRPTEGPTSDVMPRGSVTFHALREYVVGDDLRHLHWPSSAHTGTLMVRQHVDTSEPRTTLVVDTCRHRYARAELFEEAMDAAASLVAAAGTGGHFLQLATTSGLPVVNTWLEGATGCLDLLAGLSEEDPDRLGEMVERLAAEHRGESLVVVTGEIEPERLRVLAATSRRFETVAVVALRAPERPPVVSLPGLVVIDAPDAAAFAAAWNLRTRR